MNSILKHIKENYTVTRTTDIHKALFFNHKDTDFVYLPEDKHIYMTSEDGKEFYGNGSSCKTVKSLTKFVELRTQ